LTSASAKAAAPKILCAGIIVFDEVLQVERFPAPGEKVHAYNFFSVNGGCAANAAVAVARLGGRATLAGPLGVDANGDQVLAALAREQVDCSKCQRLDGVRTALSAILIDPKGERMIATHCDTGLASAPASDPATLVAGADAVLADNRFPDFVRSICLAARDRDLIVVLDADRPTHLTEDLFRIATHVVFSGECLRATTGLDDLGMALGRVAALTSSFLAVTDGERDVLWLEGAELRKMPVFPVQAVDTLGAGDVFHGAFTLALAEGQNTSSALRFAAAAASLKCARLGGSAAAPHRKEVEALLAADVPSACSREDESSDRSVRVSASGAPPARG
jgi:sulfofructose kinase